MNIRTIAFHILLSLLFLCLFVAGVGAVSLLPPNLVMTETFAPGFGAAIGRVTLVQGKAVVMHADQKQGYWIKREMLLYKNDVLVTLDRGRLRYALNDGSVLTMASESRIELSQMQMEPGQSRAAFVKLDEGRARFVVKKLLKMKRSEFKVKTPTALVGVRGSDFIIAASADATQVTTLDRTVLEVVSLAALEQPPIVLRAFQQTSIALGQLPTEVEQVDPAEIDRLEMEPVGVEGDVGAAAEEGNEVEVAEPEVLVHEVDLVSPVFVQQSVANRAREADQAVNIASDPAGGRVVDSSGNTVSRRSSSVVLDGSSAQGGGAIDVFGAQVETIITPDVTVLPRFPGPP